MPTVIHELADAFLRRKQALAERGQAKTKLAGSDYFMPKSAKEDLNNRLSVFEQGGLPELLKQGASEMYRNPIVNTAISLTPGAGDVQSGFDAYESAQKGNYPEAAANALGLIPGIPALGGVTTKIGHALENAYTQYYKRAHYDARSLGMSAENAAKYAEDMLEKYKTKVREGWWDPITKTKGEGRAEYTTSFSPKNTDAEWDALFSGATSAPNR